MRFIIKFIIFLSIFSAIAIFSFYQLTYPLLTTGTIIEIKAGENKTQFAEELARRKILTFPKLYLIFMSMQHITLKKGEYYFPRGSSLYSIWEQVSLGKGFYYRSFTIVPGWTIRQLRDALIKAEGFHHEASLADDNKWSHELHLATIPEGLFFPETYFYTKGTTDWEVLHIAYKLMLTKLQLLWEKRDINLPFKNPYEALIAASLVEKEAFHSEERPIIAGVLINRLNKKMLLQFDPSVIYGLGNKFFGVITAKDLKEKNPYNTYTNLGLPPTPIALPSLASIEAVLHPKEHQYLYFVLTNEKHHKFSITYNDHLKAVKAYKNMRNSK